MEAARWYFGLECFVSYCICVASLLLWGQGWVEGRGRPMVGQGCVEGRGKANGGGTGFVGGSSMRVVVSTYIMIVFTAFVICWVVEIWPYM